MPPAKKAKKEPSTQSSTLHAFFSPASGSTTPSKSLPRLKPRLKSNPPAKTAEVIEISDSEDEVEVVSVLIGQKRQRPSSNNSKGAEKVQKDNSFCFGEPSELLGSSHAVLQGEGLTMEPEKAGIEHPSFMFGQPTSILGPSTLKGARAAQEQRPESSTTAPPPPGEDESKPDGTTQVAEDPPLDIWDDEFDQYADDSQIMNGPEGDQPVCPYCSTTVSDEDFEIHLTQCFTIQEDCSPTVPIPSNPSDVPQPDVRAATEKKPGPKAGPSKNNAFSKLMTSFKDTEAWKEADKSEDRNFKSTKNNRRKAPFYKVLQGMPIAVDAFRYGAIPGVTAYFLTHAHSDHYTNLSSSWNNGPIYCSEGTANLIEHMLNVDKKWVHRLPMDIPTPIFNTGGVSVTLIEANHCPGSCLFYFEGLQTVNAGDSAYPSPYVGSSRTFRYLHCGDFRASPRHVNHPAIKGKKLDLIYLDTTYLDPKYTFPPQPLVISACADLAHRIAHSQPLSDKPNLLDGWTSSFKNPIPSSLNSEKGKGKASPNRTLFVIGTYTIGKERIVKAVAKRINSKIYSEPRKFKILRCQADSELDDLLTSNPLDANVHLVPLAMIASDKLKIYLDKYKSTFNKVVGFRPTGWTYTASEGVETTPSISSVLSRNQQKNYTFASLQQSRNSTSAVLLYGVPYSEHSSFFELTCFALSLDWDRIIATVNVGSENSRNKITVWVKRWQEEKKRRGMLQVVSHRQPDFW
ncbi:DRMBL-domain-containing protein [Pluteus cervinus]|uniref:DRMBL-domain-containing protein n=1 Tax=Pluteus cervinus TaxID=181527 RepID=A0ACD3BAD7_9AGAR|nr:DRMBL-domain-containing protein [Pluteus cervinus]